MESISISLSLWTMFTWTLLRHTSPFHSPMWVSLITSLWSYYPSTCHSSTMWNHQWGAWRWAGGDGLLTTTPVSRNWLEYVCPTGHRVLAHRSEHLHILCPGLYYHVYRKCHNPQTFPNQKPRMKFGVRLLLKARDNALTSQWTYHLHWSNTCLPTTWKSQQRCHLHCS